MITPRSWLAALALLASGSNAVACSPVQIDDSGFFRQEVTRLPKNALGVMFSGGEKQPSARDFTVVSADDKRALRLRVRRYGATHWVRVELANGFQPGARYEFHYVRSHGQWRYPDKLAVTIDDAAIDTAGDYALDMAPHAVARVITVPTTSGSCWEPVAAIAQEFTYVIPARLANYRDALMYDVEALKTAMPARRRQAPVLYGWPDAPELYHRNSAPLGQSYDLEYTARRNAVVAACDTPSTSGTLQGAVAFPEVDERRYRTVPVAFDLNRRTGAACLPADALVQTMRDRGAERVLGQVCYLYLGTGAYHGKQPLASRPIEEWEGSLGFHFGLSPTCNLVALAYLWQTRQYTVDQRVIARLGLALRDGLDAAQRTTEVLARPTDPPPALQQTVHALGYLVRHLPPERRDMVAIPLLAPLQPLLVSALAAPVPYQPDELAGLLLRSGALSPTLLASIRKIAGSATPGAPHARAILATAR